jgi:cardiolipin synthase
VHAPLRESNRVALYEDGGNVLEACRTLITEARRSIDVEMYIWAEDETGIEIAELLGAAVARGVSVRVLYDAVGCWEGTYHLRKLAARGRWWRSMGPFAFAATPTQEPQEALIADDSVVIVGSQNFSQYDTHRFPGFLDVGVGLSGPVVEDLARDFRRVFRKGDGEGPAAAHARARASGPTMLGESASVQMVSGVKRGERGAMRALYLTILRQAVLRSRAPGNACCADLRSSARSPGPPGAGCRWCSSCPARPTSCWRRRRCASRTARSSRRGRDLERQHRVLHAKAVVVDRAIAVVGSANLDARSFIHNLELNVNVHDSELAARLLATMEKDMEQSVRIDRAGHAARPLANRVLSFLAYLLRYWL